MSKNAQAELPWSDLPFFLALARTKTLSAAARALNLDRTTVSRRAEHLERSLGRQIFERNTGQFELTSYGRRVFSAAERAEQELKALDTTQDPKRHAFGTVRLSLSAQFFPALSKILAKFGETHPDILLQVTTSDRFVSLNRFETDVALRLSRQTPKGLSVTKLGRLSYYLYRRADLAGPVVDYITHPGRETIPEEVRAAAPDAQIVMSVDGVLPMRDLIAAGVGAGILPSFLGDADTRLAKCSVELSNGEFHLFLACMPEQKRLHRVNRLVTFLSKELAQFGEK
ncbi:HTH-type transcriptional activator CmpR [Roseibium album]|nr:HTH-type transcriptional activator CmpR [Roseibium album]